MRSLYKVFIVLTGMALTGLPSQAWAFHMPLWELGFGVGYIHAPLYRGSKTEKDYLIPFPFPIYRGESFRSDEKGVYSKIFTNDRLNLDISLSGNVPVPGDEVKAREGMPGLDTVGEIGPELEINLWSLNHQEYSLWLKLPVRAVFSVGDPLVKHQGWNFSPSLQFQRRTGTDRDWWRYRITTGPLYADSGYHNYFYEVEPQYVTTSRAEYHPDSGYSGSRLTLSLSHYSKNYFFAAFMRYDNLSNAKFVDSPLVETRGYLLGGFMFAWIFNASEILVEHYE